MSATRGFAHVSSTAMRALADPRSLAAIVVLVVNDHVLKGIAPGVVTGKLSDVAGLVFFPILLAVAIGLVVRSPKHAIVLSAGVTAVWFAAMKTLMPIAALTESAAGLFIGSSRIVVDPWDLLALPAVGGAVWIFLDTERRSPSLDDVVPFVRKALLGVSLVGALVATTATTCIEDDGLTGFLTNGDTVVAEFDSGYGDLLESRDGFDTWSPVGEARDSSGRALDLSEFEPASERQVCLSDGHCFRIDGRPDVKESLDGVSWTVAWSLPAGRLEFLERTGGGCDPYEVRSRSIVLTTGQDPVVLVAMGDDGLLRRLPDGTWERDVLHTAEPLTEAGVHIAGEAIAIAGIALLFALGAAVAARLRLNPAGGLAVGGWTVAGGIALVIGVFLLVGAGLTFASTSDGLATTVFLLPMPVFVLVGLGSLASIWSRVRDRYPSTGLRMFLWTSAVILAALPVLWSPFLAWSAGWISYWAVAACIAVGLGVGLGVVLGTLTSPRRVRPGEPLAEGETAETGGVSIDVASPPHEGPEGSEGSDTEVAPYHPWLAAAVLMLAAFFMLTPVGIVAAVVAGFFAARWTGHTRPLARSFVAAGLAGVAVGVTFVMLQGISGFVLALVGVVWLLAVVTIKGPHLTNWDPRTAVWAPRLGALAILMTAVLAWPVVFSWYLPVVFIPFVVVAFDHLGVWWDRRREESGQDPTSASDPPAA